ncbi:MAG: hypothetical protein WC770_02480 [Phycisphaerae bacterium]|jgi:hypothetical protein
MKKGRRKLTTINHQLTTILIAVLFLLPVCANATTIDFEQLGALGNGGYLGISSYSEDGFLLTTTSEFGFARKDSIALFSRYGNDSITLTRGNGGTFDFLSIDFYPYFPVGNSIEFVGTFFDNSTISRSFPPFEGYSITLEFNDFTNLKSLGWNTSGYYACFDNIETIPEPISVVFLFFGGVILRRFKH